MAHLRYRMGHEAGELQCRWGADIAVPVVPERPSGPGDVAGQPVRCGDALGALRLRLAGLFQAPVDGDGHTVDRPPVSWRIDSDGLGRRRRRGCTQHTETREE